MAAGTNIYEGNTLASCDICNRCKLTGKPFAERTGRSKGPLEIIHSDVCGEVRRKLKIRLNVERLNVDDYSQWAHVYLSKAKNKVFQKFKVFKTLVQK